MLKAITFMIVAIITAGLIAFISHQINNNKKNKKKQNGKF